jgi:hypothetical protein
MLKQGEQIAGPKADLRAMQILCAALMIGVIFFAAISVGVVILNGEPIAPKEELLFQVLLYTAVVIAVAGIVASRVLYTKKLAVIKNENKPLPDKLNQYRALLLLYMAICEGAALFSVIVFFLTGNFVVLIITAVMLLVMFSKMPTKQKLITELSLDWKEQQEFE